MEARPRPSLSLRAQAAFLVFTRCETQWRHGFDGPTGLDYSAARDVADAEEFEWAEILPLLAVIEKEYLKQLGERRARLRAATEQEAKARR